MNPRRAVVAEQYPWRKDSHGKPLCAFCGKALRPDQQRVKYCSHQCADQVYVRCWPARARLLVKRRDKGVCARCGCDCQKVKRIVDALKHELHDRPAAHWLLGELGFTRTHLWEVHHKIAVSEGGALCGLGNLETLCIPCHNAETAALRRKPVLIAGHGPLFAGKEGKP